MLFPDFLLTSSEIDTIMCMAQGNRTHAWETCPMRTNILIDDDLMKEVLKATGLKTKKEAVELGLKTLIRLKKQESIKSLKGRLVWEGDVDSMRSER